MSYTTEEIMAMSDEEAEKALRNLGSDDEEEAQVDQPEDDVEPETEEPTEEEDEEAVVEEESDEEEEVEPEEQPEDLDEAQPEEEAEEETAQDSTQKTADVFDFTNVPRDVVLPDEIAVNGVKVKATLDELVNGFKKGMNYTQKMQELAPHRKTIEAMEENGLTQTDLNLLIEARKGNKEAMSKLLVDGDIDALDLETEKAKDYAPKNYIGETEDFAMEEVKTLINNDVEYVDKVKEAINIIPDDLYQIVSKEPQVLNALYNDVKNGTFDKVMPEVMKQKALGGMGVSTMDLYSKVYQDMKPQAAEVKTPAPVVDVKDKKKLASKRKDASMTKTKPTAKKKHVNYAEMDEDEFAKEYEQIMGRKLGAD